MRSAHFHRNHREQRGELRSLRRARLRALETRWYLRLVENSPTIPELYEQLFPIQTILPKFGNTTSFRP